MSTGDTRDSTLCMCDVVCVTEVARHPWRSAAFSMPLDGLGLRPCLAITYLLLFILTDKATAKGGEGVGVIKHEELIKLEELC